MNAPLRLPANPVRRFYRGGAAIAALRGAAAGGDDNVPEDWVGSTTEAFGEPGVGLSLLPDGTRLRDAVAADPESWLGAAHVARRGADPALLVKLLDAGERLPVHAHPDGPFARRHLGTRFGKTEAWIVIGGSGPVHAGWCADVETDRLRAWVESQDADALLGALNRVEVSAGDALLVPAGMPHAIGAGLLIVELQEPSDMSVMLEWEGHGIDGQGEATLGLGWETALACVERTARDPRALLAMPAQGPVASALVADAEPFFRARWLTAADGASVDIAAGYAVLLVLDGTGRLEAAGAAPLSLARGDTVIVPDAAGPLELSGRLRALHCAPPRADAAEGAGR